MFGGEPDALLHKSIGSLPQVIFAQSLRHDIDDLTKPLLSGRPAVVFDKNTAETLGERVTRALKAAPILLPGIPTPDMETVEYIRRESAGCAGLVAVGSGTINDLCKYATFLDDKPYIVFPTAASMNGYVSANASITVEGYKSTFTARMPRAVFCDLSVIAAAPARLSRSGLGDSLARPTAQADWLLSHLLLGTNYNDVPFELLKSFEPQLFESARGIGKGDSACIELLMKVLLLSGFGMTIAGGSYPASQGEHMVAHLCHPGPRLRGDKLRRDPVTFHGEQIGVTTLFMSRRQEAMLRKQPSLLPLIFPTKTLEEIWGNKATKEAQKSYKKKQERIIESDSDSRLRDAWESVAGRIEKIHLPPERIATILQEAGAPDVPEELGWDRERYAAATEHARFFRDRFTFLDIA